MKSMIAMFDSWDDAREAVQRIQQPQVSAHRMPAVEMVFHPSRELAFGGLSSDEGADGPSPYIVDTCKKVAEVARNRHRGALLAGAVLVVAAWKYRADADAAQARIADLTIEEPPERQSGTENRASLPYRGNTALAQPNRADSTRYTSVGAEHGTIDV
jgi:hypothetical protein